MSGKSSVRIAVIALMAILIWAYFDAKNQTLDAPSTLVVVAACGLVVLGVEWLWTHLRRPRAR
jgi:hypothetical protein